MRRPSHRARRPAVTVPRRLRPSPHGARRRGTGRSCGRPVPAWARRRCPRPGPRPGSGPGRTSTSAGCTAPGPPPRARALPRRRGRPRPARFRSCRRCRCTGAGRRRCACLMTTPRLCRRRSGRSWSSACAAVAGRHDLRSYCGDLRASCLVEVSHRPDRRTSWTLVIMHGGRGGSWWPVRLPRSLMACARTWRAGGMPWTRSPIMCICWRI